MSTLKTHNLQSPDAGSVNIVMAPNAGMVVAGISTFNNKVLIGTNTVGDSTADDLTIETSGSTGITLRSDSGYAGNIQFADGTSGDDQQRGVLQYHHSDNSMRFMTNASERIRIGSVGQIGIAGANYGTSGQVLTSQGNSSAVQWATPSSFPSHIDIWRITSDTSLSSGNYLTSNWNRAPQSSAEDQLTALKGAQVTQSSGVFTFPTTGIWQIMFQIEIYKNGACRWFEAGMIGTVDNFSSERVLATGYASLFSSGANTHASARTSTFYKVSNVSNNKIKFRTNMAASVTNESSLTANNTWVEFVRVSDI